MTTPSTAPRLSWRDLDVRWTRVAAAILVGALALTSAVGLTATSAWLIAKAAELPSPADLALAAVLVRAFGISRGILRYAERLRSHDTALRGVTTLRARVVERLANGDPARVLRLSRGDIVVRAGADLDSVGDAVVRAIVPVGVAILVSTASIAIVASQHAIAGAALAAGILLAAIVPGLLTSRAARVAEREGVEAEAGVAVATLGAIEGATEARVWGTVADGLARLDVADRRLGNARAKAARPTATAAASLVLAQGGAVVASVALAVAALHVGAIAGPAAAIVALTPLAAFEAVAAVSPAVAQAYRSRAAWARVDGLIVAAGVASPSGGLDVPALATKPGPVLELDSLRAAHPDAAPTRALSLRLEPGRAIGVIGPSGVGKTTLLLTIAGALPPASGMVAVDGRPVTSDDLGVTLAFTAEDAHVFGTSILENLRVARGDVTPAEAERALDSVGLGPWLARQPGGLDTLLGSGGLTVSGGERRRLLLARAMLHPAPIRLVDEPAEHLDEAGTDVVRAFVRQTTATGRSIVVVTHDHDLLDVVDTVVDLG